MNPLAAAIFLSALAMGILGLFVVFPIVFIGWSWNTVVTHFTVLPHIRIWQASLLYAAVACVSYLMGWVQIDFKTETVD
jgi:hypothetical protein